MRVAAWNVEGRMASYLKSKSKRGTPAHILRGIEALDADVLVFPEAYNGSGTAPEIDARLQELGYDWFDTPYNDPNREEEIAMYGKSNIRLASRLGFVSEKIERFGTRNLPVGIIEEPQSGEQIRILGTHLEDRSEAQRQEELDAIIPYINESDMPTIMMGDFNALWPGLRASLIGSLATRLVAHALPQGDLQSELSRLIEMATGTTMERLVREAHLREVDDRHQATVTPKKRNFSYFPAVRLCQIDHILVSKEIQASDFKIAKDSGSDHRGISANIAFRTP